MTTPKKLEANRKNAQRSTGPRSQQGKDMASRNALRHGLCTVEVVVPGESTEEWVRHRDGVLHSLNPQGHLEEELTLRVALILWRLRRVAIFEQGVIATGLEAVEKDAQERHSDTATPFDLPDSFSPGSQRSMERKLAEKEDQLSVWDHQLQLLASLGDFPGINQDLAIDGEEACQFLDDLITHVLDVEAACDIENPAFLQGIGVPEEYHLAPWEWPAWTLGHLRGAVQAICAEAGVPAPTLLRQVQKEWMQVHAGVEGDVHYLRGQVENARQKAERQAVRLRRNRTLPEAVVLDKITRYEAHLTRQMLAALHTLQRLQAARGGSVVSPPVAVDLTVNMPEGSG